LFDDSFEHEVLLIGLLLGLAWWRWNQNHIDCWYLASWFIRWRSQVLLFVVEQ